MENLELESVRVATATSVLSKAVRTLLATAILGSVAAYAAITVEPQLVDYLSFIPGMEPVASQCSATACGSCGSKGACGAACNVDYGCCSTEGGTCNQTSDQTISGVLTEEPSSETTDSAVAEEPAVSVSPTE
jgi:hypothetical protein